VTLVLDDETVIEDGTFDRPCHIVKPIGNRRALCGRFVSRPRPHTRAACEAAGHFVCPECLELSDED
jgi:hypothetical protein